MKETSRFLQVGLVAMIWFSWINGALAQDIETNKIEVLRSQLTDELSKVGTRRENEALIKKLRDDLAKAGDASERKKIIANMKDTDPRVQFAAIKSAKYVGGGDMISALAALLNDTNGCRAVQGATGPQGQPPRDALIFDPPRIMAAEALANLVKNPPVPPVGEGKKLYTEEDVERWRTWWKANKAKYGE